MFTFIKISIDLIIFIIEFFLYQTIMDFQILQYFFFENSKLAIMIRKFIAEDEKSFFKISMSEYLISKALFYKFNLLDMIKV